MKKINSRLIKYFCIILISIGLIFAYIKIEPLKNFLNLILLSLIFAYLLKPLRNYISNKFKLNYKYSSILLIIILVLITFITINSVITHLVNGNLNLDYLIDNIEEYVRSIVVRFNLEGNGIFNNIYNDTYMKITSFVQSFTENIFDYLVIFFDNIISLAIIPVITYYFLVDGELIFNKMLLILPTEKRTILKKIIINIDKILERYIFSQFLLSVIIGILTYILLAILDVKFALILALLNGVFNIIPYFGPVIGGIPAILIALIDSPSKGLWTILGIFIIQQLEGNILSPKITGDSTNMHPIIIIILLLIGENLGGFVGMIMAVPIGVIIKVIYDDINYYLF